MKKTTVSAIFGYCLLVAPLAVQAEQLPALKSGAGSGAAAVINKAAVTQSGVNPLTDNVISSEESITLAFGGDSKALTTFKVAIQGASKAAKKFAIAVRKDAFGASYNLAGWVKDLCKEYQCAWTFKFGEMKTALGNAAKSAAVDGWSPKAKNNLNKLVNGIKGLISPFRLAQEIWGVDVIKTEEDAARKFKDVCIKCGGCLVPRLTGGAALAGI